MVVCGLGNLSLFPPRIGKGVLQNLRLSPRDSLNMTPTIGTRDPQCWISLQVCEYSRMRFRWILPRGFSGLIGLICHDVGTFADGHLMLLILGFVDLSKLLGRLR
jgi:hypothetical protein